MALIKIGLSICLFILPGFFPVFGQETASLQKDINDECVRLEALVDNSTNDTERHSALRTLARLEQLRGAYEAAAAFWTEAAYARSGNRDDAALLEAASCYISIGELDKAMADVTTVLLSVKDVALLLKARYLGAQIEALKGEPGSLQTLSALVGDPDHAERQSVILYLLFRISGEASYAETLKNRYPQSTEALLLEKDLVQLKALPYWYLPADRSVLELTQVRESAESGAQSVSAHVPEENSKAETPDASSDDAATAESRDGLLGLQVGLFSTESNAQSELQRLSAKGFSGAIVSRSIEGKAYWAVLVPVASDVNTMIIRLKDAGFESFPVFTQ